jgi:hypothetical protein
MELWLASHLSGSAAEGIADSSPPEWEAEWWGP